MNMEDLKGNIDGTKRAKPCIIAGLTVGELYIPGCPVCGYNLGRNNRYIYCACDPVIYEKLK